MNEIKTEKHDMICKKCDVPYEIDNSKQLLTHPPQYIYECPVCKQTKTSRYVYPYISYTEREITEDKLHKKVDNILRIMEYNEMLLNSKSTLPTNIHLNFGEYGYDYFD